MSNKDLWVKVLKRLQPTIQKSNFITWFQHTTIVSNENGVAVVGVPTSFALNWLFGKYHLKISQAIKEADPTVEDVKYDVRSILSDDPKSGSIDIKTVFVEEFGKKIRKVRNQNEVMVKKPGTKHAINSQMLNSRYELSNFVIGSDNRLPHAACQAVSSEPGGIYNPLYIYGGVGLGKTHLVQGIGNEILKYFPDMTVKYTTAERFVSEVVEAIGKRNMPQFKDRYRHVDCFLIDDIQFFARKDSSQQEFFHTFDQLRDANKQIVLTSDRPPSELQELDQRLVSRFSMGMVVELLMPDYETRLAILNQKCKEFQMIVDPEILNFVASNITESVRELEGVLRQILAENQMFNSISTLKSVANIIRRMDKARKIIGYDFDKETDVVPLRTAIDVVRIVAGYYDVPVEKVLGKDRRREFMIPRQVSMYLIKNELRQSYEKIGESFEGRTHTTVMHACGKTVKQLRKDLRLIRDINSIKRDMGL